MEKLEHIIKTIPAFSKRNSDPKKDYGVGSMRVCFIVKGEKGAIQFLLNTGGYLKSVIDEWIETGKSFDYCGYLEGWDLGYHSPTPQYNGQIKNDNCNIIPGGCYYDGTSLGASEPLDIFINEGEDGLWKFLEKVYKHRFQEESA